MFGEAEQEEARHPARQGAAIAIFLYSVGQNVSRGAGQSAVKVAAYQGRKNYIDERTGYHYNYQPREHGGIAAASAYIGREGGYDEGRKPALFVGLYAPEKAPGWCRGAENVEHFWNRLEVFERRVDAQIAERHIIALPHELTLQQNIWALQDFVRDAFTRQGRVVQVAIHAPEHGDGRNIHAHLLISIRGVNEHGFNASKEAAQDRFRHRREYVQELRALWAETANRHLGRHGHEERIDHRTLAEQGIKREPTMHLGPGDSRRERQGERSAAGEINREVAARNAERQRQALDRAHEARHHEPLQREAAQEAARPREAARPSIARREATPASGGPQHVRRGPSEGSAADDPAIREIDAWRAGIEREWQGQGSPVKPIAPDPRRETENARLAREALLDRRADGKPRTIRETAFELSLDYRDALREIDGQKGAVAAAERRIKGAERGKEIAEYRVAERRAALGRVRLALHKRGWATDRDLGHWEGRVKAAERGIERAYTHRTTARDALAMWERRAELAFAAVLPAAERELTQRQDRATAARAELARRGLWISEPEHVGDGQERDDLIEWHGFQLGKLREVDQKRQAQKAPQTAAKGQKQAPAAVTRPAEKPRAAQRERPVSERQEDAMRRYVSGMISRNRSRPEYEAEEEARRQKQRQRYGHRQKL